MVRPLRQTLVPIFLPHQGCQRRCIYCNQSVITGQSGKESFSHQIDAGLAGRTEPVEVALYSGNLFGLPAAELIDLFRMLERYRPVIGSIRISTKPVPLDQTIVAIIKQAGVRVIELGMPSFNDGILAALDRGYTTAEFYTSYRYLERAGFTLGLQVMVGLPGETEADLESMRRHLSALHPFLLRVYPLLVLEGTRLHGLFDRGEFLPLSIDEAVQRTATLYLHALRERITVIRMGLSADEVLEQHVVAGPYHPSFGFLVKAHVFMRAIVWAWNDLGQPPVLKIRLNSSDIPHLIGYKRRHIEVFKELGVKLSWETDRLKKDCFVAESLTGGLERTIADRPS